MRPLSLAVISSLGAAIAACAAPEAEALWGRDGALTVRWQDDSIATLSASLAEPGWQFRSAGPERGAPSSGSARALQITTAAGPVKVRADARPAAGGIGLEYQFSPTAPTPVMVICAAWNLPADFWRGGRWTADGRSGDVPAEFGPVSLFTGSVRSFSIQSPRGPKLTLTCAQPQNLLLQDDRQWGPSFSIRIGPGGNPLNVAAPLTVAFTASLDPAMTLSVDEPVTLQANQDWVPLDGAVDVQPGSALDFTSLGLLDGPAGKHGWLKADRQGRMVFEQRPDQPVKLYGVNLCFTALYPDHDLADRVADRLARLGYNAVRIHHYEGNLVDDKAPDSLTFRPQQLDRLEYFAAALKKRGLYLTTDLFVSRPVRAKEAYAAGGERVAMDEYKLCVLVSDRARGNLKEFSRRLFGHVNPYTGQTWAKDPALNMLSLVNEGMLLNFLGGASERLRVELKRSWSAWLTQRYGDRAKLQAAWDGRLPDGQDPAQGSVALPRGTDGIAGRDVAIWAADVHRAFIADMRRFLREELGSRALITDLNAWTDVWPMQGVRQDLDYVDNHSYWDHPHFLEQAWRLPTRGGNHGGSAVSQAAPLHRSKAVTQLLDRPFGFSEFNYSGPNASRAEGGPLTGAYGALQGWDAIWRFAYSHGVDNLRQPQASNFFDVAADPAMLASDRFGILLFRRDAATAKATVALCTTRRDLDDGQVPLSTGQLAELSLVTRLGSLVDAAGQPGPGELRLELQGKRPDLKSPGATQQVLQQLKDRGLIAKDNPTDLDQRVYVSDTGQLRLEPARGLFVYATPGSVGAFSAKGQAAQVGLLSIKPGRGPVGVYVASLSAAPVTSAPRLLVAHVPDIQGSGRRYGERGLRTLLDWGKLPHLVRDVTTTVALKIDQPAGVKVYALGLDGARLAEVPAETRDGALTFDAQTRLAGKGVIYYEVTRG